MIGSRGSASLARLVPWLRASAVAAALASMLALFLRNRTIPFNEVWFLPANRTAILCSLIAIVSGIGALMGERPSRAWWPSMGISIFTGLAVLVYGAWIEIVLAFLKHVCWTGSC